MEGAGRGARAGECVYCERISKEGGIRGEMALIFFFIMVLANIYGIAANLMYCNKVGAIPNITGLVIFVGLIVHELGNRR